MLNSVYIVKGKVVKVTPDGVDVQEFPCESLPGGRLHYFDTKGKERYKPEEEWGPEWAPFELDDIPFAEQRKKN